MTRRKFLEGVAGLGMSAPSRVLHPQNAAGKYYFYRTISRSTLNNYLSRSVTHSGLLAACPEAATPYFTDDLRMIKAIGAKFIGRAAYAYASPDDDDAHFEQVKRRASAALSTDPDLLLQAGVFEAVYKERISQVRVPEWAFVEFGLTPTARGFDYNAMLYADDRMRNQWAPGCSVPDMSRTETKMYFYYRARRYIDSGIEAIHFGQVHLMDHADPGWVHWSDLLARVRAYAAMQARRKLVLCDAHTHGVVISGALLFDFHSSPCRPKEVPGNPQQTVLASGYADSLYGSSRGGKTASGWQAKSLPYLVEMDQVGMSSEHADESGLGPPWVWGREEMSWFARQPAAYRNAWLAYAWNWVRDRHEDGWFQFPTRNKVSEQVNGISMYHANRRSSACPDGFDQENAIQNVWYDDDHTLKR